MIQDKMIDEIQELKLAGYTLSETYDALKLRHTKVPTLKTVRKYYNMDSVPADNHASMKKSMAFDFILIISATSGYFRCVKRCEGHGSLWFYDSTVAIDRDYFRCVIDWCDFNRLIGDNHAVKFTTSVEKANARSTGTTSS